MIPNLLLVSSLTFIVIFMSCLTRYGASIKCYECNTAPMYDPEGICKNVLTHPKNNTVAVDCEAKYERCRVVVQEVEGDTRIIRSCATWPMPPSERPAKPESKCMDRTGTSKIKMRYCECYDDHCNGVSSLVPSALGLASLALAAAIFGLCW